MQQKLGEAPPVVPPYNPGLAFWRFWNNEFTHPVMEFPTEHLLGKTLLEYSVAVAELKFENGHSLDSADENALWLANEQAFGGTEEDEHESI
jgi:hypothetical protein